MCLCVCKSWQYQSNPKGNDKLIWKLIWKYKWSRIAKTIFSKNKFGRAILHDLKIHYKVLVIKTMLYSWRNRHRSIKMGSTEIDQTAYDHPVFDDVFKIICWEEKTSLTNSAGTIRYIYGIKRNINIYPKVNLIWNIALYTKIKTITVLNKRVDYLCELEVGKDLDRH